MRLCNKHVIFISTFIALYVLIVWRTLIRDAINGQQQQFPGSLCSELINATSTVLIKTPLSLSHLNRYLQRKLILIDPRLISNSRQDVNQTHIGEEKLDDILGEDTILMAFFKKDRLKILNLLKWHKLKWRERVDNSLEVDLQCSESYHLVPFSLSKTRDYYQFVLQNVTRAVPRFNLTRYGSLNIPENWVIFERYLRRSRFIGCLQTYAAKYREAFPKLFVGKPKVPNGIIRTLRRFRDWAIEHGATPMLYAGTLLGWYRECGIITHTYDVDFAIFIEEYYDDFAQDIRNSSFMKLSQRLNKPEDLLEYKVYIERHIPMDIFFLYHDKNQSWIGGLDQKYKYRFYYPVVDRVCATDLLGYLMYVPCNPLDLILSEHGENWTKPLLSSKYMWNKSPLNTKVVGTNSNENSDDFLRNY